MINDIETRAVLAAAYRGKSVSRLTHSLDTLTDEVLCGRVDADSLADSFACDIKAVPTCATCRRRLAKRAAS